MEQELIDLLSKTTFKHGIFGLDMNFTPAQINALVPELVIYIEGKMIANAGMNTIDSVFGGKS